MWYAVDMELSDALDFIRDRRQGVVVTVKSDGRPQLSNILYVVGDDGTIRVSATDGRAKTRNLRRDARASLYVTADDFGSYCVIEGDVDITPTTNDPDDAIADALVTYYRTLSGEHPDWSEYRRTMVDEGRLLLVLTASRAYGMLSR